MTDIDAPASEARLAVSAPLDLDRVSNGDEEGTPLETLRPGAPRCEATRR